jgi:hypothetical protein
VSIISGAAGLKFSDGVARSTYNKALTASSGNGRSASRFAKVRHTNAAQHHQRHDDIMCCMCPFYRSMFVVYVRLQPLRMRHTQIRCCA